MLAGWAYEWTGCWPLRGLFSVNVFHISSSYPEVETRVGVVSLLDGAVTEVKVLVPGLLLKLTKVFVSGRNSFKGFLGRHGPDSV